MDHRISFLDLHDKYPNKSTPTSEPKATSWQARLVRYDIITLVRGKIILRCALETPESRKMTTTKILFRVKREHLYPHQETERV